ncbi:MAG: hypothetical protein RL341_1282 [Pseudomonadota bacterium]|jgi:toxin-antitoxin system PIN domain toxin
MRALLDINVLIALLDPDSPQNVVARQWLLENQASGWASCPITQNGCIRIMSQPAYPNALAVNQVIDRLAYACGKQAHEFWADDLSLLDERRVDAARLLGHRQVTDAYLLALAVAHGGRFVTFDNRIVLDAVRGAKPHHLLVL